LILFEALARLKEQFQVAKAGQEAQATPLLGFLVLTYRKHPTLLQRENRRVENMVDHQKQWPHMY